MARPLPLARDAVFVCAGADSAQRMIIVGSPDWYDWLSEVDHITETLVIEILLVVSLVAIAVRCLRVPDTVALVLVGLVEE